MLATILQISPGTQNLVKIGQKYREVYTMTSGRFIISGDKFAMNAIFEQHSVFLYF
jgi:hypothetical protein